MKYNVVRSTEDPVVEHYMNILLMAGEKSGGETKNVQYKCKHNKKDVMVCDSALVALHYFLRGYKNIVIWYQGVVPEESYLRNKSKIRSSVLSIIELIGLKSAKACFFVSDEMLQHYEQKYHMSLKCKSYIMPCFNEIGLNKEAFQNESKSSPCEFLYAGSLNEWQCFRQTAELYAHIEQKAVIPTKFCVYTREKEKAKKIIDHLNIKSYLVDYVDASELANRIKSCRYGFVLRENSVINRVATPTKFSNYLANGIIPIFSDCLKSFYLIHKRHKIGIVCNINNIEQSVEDILKNMEKEQNVNILSEKCKEVFDTYYNTEKYIDEIAQFFQKIPWKK